MENDEKLYWPALIGTPGIGPKTFFELLGGFGSAKAVWEASAADLREAGVGKNVRKLIKMRREVIDPKTYVLGMAKKGVEVVTMMDEEYPSLLLEISNAPPVLFVRGSLKSEDNHSIAIVGTRKPTSYGREIAANFSSDLVRNGFTIVSGLARGIDGIAHRAALGAGGRTIAFLGGGIDKVQPAEHRALAEQIIKSGALVSEFPPGLEPSRGSFPARNRLISGMSLGSLIVEGLSKSGTKHTANHAKAQNRPVFAVPGPINSRMSDAPMDLLFDGAVMVREPKNIVDYLAENGVEMANEVVTSSREKPEIELANEEERLLFSLIENEPLDGDEIVRLSNLSTQQVLTTLSMMEIRGIVKNESGKYSIVSN